MIDHYLFDLDGTVTTEEILPRIARAIGVEDRIAELTRLTIQGSIPFEYSLRQRVDILNVSSVQEVRSIVSGVGLDPLILKFLHENAERCTIVTGNLDVWLEDLVPRLGVRVLSSVVEVANGKIARFSSVMDKGRAARRFAGSICAIGDGANDVEMFTAAKIGVAYGGVHEPARPLLEVATHAVYDGATLCRFLPQLS